MNNLIINLVGLFLIFIVPFSDGNVSDLGYVAKTKTPTTYCKWEICPKGWTKNFHPMDCDEVIEGFLSQDLMDQFKEAVFYKKEDGEMKMRTHRTDCKP